MLLALWKCGCEGPCGSQAYKQTAFQQQSSQTTEVSQLKDKSYTLVVVMMAVNLWKGGKYPLAATPFGWPVQVAVCGKAGKTRCGELMTLVGQISRTGLQHKIQVIVRGCAQEQSAMAEYVCLTEKPEPGSCTPKSSAHEWAEKNYWLRTARVTAEHPSGE
jgi:hypothetical protein